MDRTVPPGAAKLLEFISKTETGRGDDTAYNTVYGRNERKLTKRIMSMTVDELLENQAGFTSAFGSSAAGAFQIMRATLAGLKSELRLRGNQVFDADLQDRLGYHLLKRRGYDAWAAGKISDDTFATNLAKEWASFPVLRPQQGAHAFLARGQSYYAGDRLNKALVAPERVEALLAGVKGLPSVISADTPAKPVPTTPPGSGGHIVIPPKPKKRTGFRAWLDSLFFKPEY